MVLAVLPMVELVEVAEGVHDGLEDRFPKIGVDIYTESIHIKIREASPKSHPISNQFYEFINFIMKGIKSSAYSHSKYICIIFLGCLQNCRGKA